MARSKDYALDSSVDIDQERRLQSHLAQLLSELLQALFGVGKYAQAAWVQGRGDRRLAGLHSLFRGLMRDRDELSLSRDAAEATGVLVEGILPEPITLGALLHTGFGGVLVPRLLSFFATRGLASVSLRSELASEELEQFLWAWACLPPISPGRRDPPGTIRAVAGLRNVSILTTSQLVGLDRPLTWSAQLALSQLACDLVAIAHQSESSGQAPGLSATSGASILEASALAEGQCEAFQRAVRRVGRAELLAELLRHADILVPAAESAGEIALEKGLIAAIPPALLGPTLAELTRIAGPPDRAADPRLQPILVRMAEATLASGAPDRDEALAAFFRSRAVPIEGLSAPLRDFVLVRRLVRELLGDASATLARLHQDPEAHAPFLGPLLVELVRGGHHHLAAPVLALALAVPEATSRLREVVGRERVVPDLLAKFETGTREQRSEIADLLVLLGSMAVELLIAFMARSGDRGARRGACDVLRRIGAAALPNLTAHLERPGLPWYVVRNLLFVLSSIGGQVAVDLRPFLRHSHPRVREEAVHALVQIHGREAESALVAALRDPHPGVRARAVMAMADLRSDHLGFLRFLVEAIRRKGLTEPEEDEQVQNLACTALQRLGNIPYPGGRRIDAILAEALAAGRKRAVLGVLGGGFRAKPPAVQAAIAETLAALGSPAAARG